LILDAASIDFIRRISSPEFQYGVLKPDPVSRHHIEILVSTRIILIAPLPKNFEEKDTKTHPIFPNGYEIAAKIEALEWFYTPPPYFATFHFISSNVYILSCFISVMQENRLVSYIKCAY